MASSAALAAPPSAKKDQSVIVHFTYGTTDLTPLFALEDRLEAAITANKSGEFDGDEVAVGGADGFLYMYGPDADRLLATILPILEAVPFMKGAKATKRYGPPDPGVRTVVHVINQ